MNHLSEGLSSGKQFEVSDKLTGKPLNIGTGFQALSFKHDQFNGLMDPIVMVDHYTMTQPTFGKHPHAGMSAVTILFEDSDGVFNNRDSLGNDIDLLPGDAYWLKAGAGAIHDEKPTPGSRAHGLQIFVNLPQSFKHDAPDSLHVPTATMPVIQGDGFKARLIFGNSNGINGAASPALPFTALDIHLDNGGSYAHQVDNDQSTLVYAVAGSVSISIDVHTIDLAEGQAIALVNGPDTQQLQLTSSNGSHVTVLQGTPIREKFVQKGPFVMSNMEELDRISKAYETGLLGAISTRD